MARAAAAWLGSLDQAQRQVAACPGPADSDRTGDRLRWYYTPTDHGGLTFHDQRPAQQGLAHQLLSTGLSFEGYVTVCSILGLDNVLDLVEGFGVDWGRERGRDPHLFYLRVFGEPRPDGTWGWRFGGHHVSLNYTVVGGRLASVTPNFLGADPAQVPFVGSGRLRPLGGPEDTARELLHDLDPHQLDTAVLLDRAVSDIVSGNRIRVSHGDTMIHMQDLWNGRFAARRLVEAVDRVDRLAEDNSGYDAADHQRLAITSVPKGLGADRMSQRQRGTLRLLLAAFYRRAPGELAEELAAFYREDANLDPVHFAWAGGAAPRDRHYFRVQGPRILAEYDNTQRDGNHVHSVWRDPVADFGLDRLDA